MVVIIRLLSGNWSNYLFFKALASKICSNSLRIMAMVIWDVFGTWNKMVHCCWNSITNFTWIYLSIHPISPTTNRKVSDVLMRSSISFSGKNTRQRDSMRSLVFYPFQRGGSLNLNSFSTGSYNWGFGRKFASVAKFDSPKNRWTRPKLAQGTGDLLGRDWRVFGMVEISLVAKWTHVLVHVFSTFNVNDVYSFGVHNIIWRRLTKLLKDMNTLHSGSQYQKCFNRTLSGSLLMCSFCSSKLI